MRICVMGLRGLPAVIGGIETYCEEVYVRLATMAPDLDILLITRNDHGVQDVRDFKGLRLRSLWAPRISGLETLVHTALGLIYARLFVHPHVVHLHGIGPGLYAGLSRLFGFKTVVIHHARDFERPKWGELTRALLRLGERTAAHFADKIICVSASIRSDLVARYPVAESRAITIRNGGARQGVEPACETRVMQEFGLRREGYILAVGRLEATKAFHELIEAHERAVGLQIPLVIVGSAFFEDAYSSKLMRSGSQSVRFLGFQTGSTLHALYKNAALFIHPSHMEGFGLVIAEALCADRPAAISDIPAHREFELDEHSYFPAGDIEAMTRIMAGGDYAQYYCAHACEAQRLNTWDLNADRQLVLLRDMERVSGPRRRTHASIARRPSR